MSDLKIDPQDTTVWRYDAYGWETPPAYHIVQIHHAPTGLCVAQRGPTYAACRAAAEAELTVLLTRIAARTPLPWETRT